MLGVIWGFGPGGYSGYILVGVCPGTPKRGGLRCGQSPKRGVLGVGIDFKKGVLGQVKKKGVFTAAHTYTEHICEYPPPPGFWDVLFGGSYLQKLKHSGGGGGYN